MRMPDVILYIPCEAVCEGCTVSCARQSRVLSMAFKTTFRDYDLRSDIISLRTRALPFDPTNGCSCTEKVVHSCLRKLLSRPRLLYATRLVSPATTLMVCMRLLKLAISFTFVHIVQAAVSKLDAVVTAAVPMHRVAQAELPSRTAAGLAASVSIPRLISIIVDHAALCARHLLEQLLFAQQGNVQPTARQGTHCVALNVCLLALVQPHVLTQQSTLSLAAPPASLPQN